MDLYTQEDIRFEKRMALLQRAVTHQFRRVSWVENNRSTCLALV